MSHPGNQNHSLTHWSQILSLQAKLLWDGMGLRGKRGLCRDGAALTFRERNLGAAGMSLKLHAAVQANVCSTLQVYMAAWCSKQFGSIANFRRSPLHVLKLSGLDCTQIA